ncbi:hypothetical protein [Parasitella parasitica]|uniref:Tc1-like transposase DDE domain-containing protein n=1 Tax=Parasitella parasitica TaxID=35722 RepID=A0A0B7N4J2_9FUNG|nr:hypothetical protein [Parasitella parasitica]
MQMHPALLRSVNRGNTRTLKNPKAMTTITKKTFYTAIMMLSAEFIGYPYDICTPTEWATETVTIFNCSRAGVNQSVICKTMGLSPSTVHNVLLRAGKLGDGIPRKRSGGAKALNKRNERALVRQVRAKPLKPMKYHLSAWCEGHTKILIDTFGSNDSGARVLQKEGERYDSKHVIKTTKFGSGSLMLWGCFCKPDRIHQVSAGKLLPWISEMIEKEDATFILQEDGAPGHTGKIARDWKNDQPEILGFDFWPAQSPDLNPIEHLLAILEKRIKGRRHAIGSKDELEACLRDEWSKLDVGLAEKLVQSMASRCKEVIKAKGESSYHFPLFKNSTPLIEMLMKFIKKKKAGKHSISTAAALFIIMGTFYIKGAYEYTKGQNRSEQNLDLDHVTLAKRAKKNTPNDSRDASSNASPTHA